MDQSELRNIIEDIANHNSSDDDTDQMTDVSSKSSSEDDEIVQEYTEICDDIESIYDDFYDGWYNYRKYPISEIAEWINPLADKLKRHARKLRRLIKKLKSENVDTIRGEMLLQRV